VSCTHTATVTRDSGPHIGEFCADCDTWIRWVPRREAGKATRSVSRSAIKPRTRAIILDRYGHSCFTCGATAPDVILHIDHLIPVELAKRYGVYDEVIEDDLNLITACEECNLGKGAEVYTARSIRLMHRSLTVAYRRENRDGA
jgi:5-methylcytosine-specific restriction endonuclease McrA